jgi:hypothetical protein
MTASKVPSRTPDKCGFDILNCPSPEGIFVVHTPITSPIYPRIQVQEDRQVGHHHSIAVAKPHASQAQDRT